MSPEDRPNPIKPNPIGVADFTASVELVKQSLATIGCKAVVDGKEIDLNELQVVDCLCSSENLTLTISFRAVGDQLPLRGEGADVIRSEICKE